MEPSPKLLEIAHLLREEPATGDKFVDRARELEELKKALLVFKGSAVGLTGERGIGKTSIMLKLKEEGKSIYVRIFQRESVEAILEDLLIGLAKELGDRYRNILDHWKLSNLSASIGTGGVQGEMGVEKVRKPVSDVVEAIRRELDKERDITIIIDELDKEPYEELVRVLDAIKFAFEGANTTLLIALPPTVEARYRKALAQPSEVANTEGFLSYVLSLPPMPKEALLEALERRIGGLLSLIEGKALDLALHFAMGNPRKFFTILRHAVMYSEKRITREAVERAIGLFLQEYVARFGLTSKERALLRLIKPGVEKRELAEKAVKAKLFKALSNAYLYLQRLAKKGVIREEEGQLYLHPIVEMAMERGLI